MSCVAAIVALPWWVWALLASPIAVYLSFACFIAWRVATRFAPQLARHIEQGLRA